MTTSNEKPTPESPATTIKVVATTGGFKSFVAFLAAMFIFAIVFFVGIVAGAAGFSAASKSEGIVHTQTMHDGGRSTIAVLNISGVIDDSNASFAKEAIDKILDDNNVKAVVLRVNSPGGGVTASDEIWHNMERFIDAKIPLIASYGSVAASGGYYISCNADHIMAQETTITGSIGVIASIMTMHGLMDKLGITPVTLIAEDSPEKSVANDVYRDWNDKDKQKVAGFLDAMYDVFYNRVKGGRMNVIQDPKKLASVANGSAYTANEALDNGLIDSIGYLEDAITVAEQRAGLTSKNPTVVRYSRNQPMFGGFFGAKSQDFTASDLRSLLQEFSMPKLQFMYN
jgi:protease-4